MVLYGIPHFIFGSADKTQRAQVDCDRRFFAVPYRVDLRACFGKQRSVIRLLLQDMRSVYERLLLFKDQRLFAVFAEDVRQRFVSNRFYGLRRSPCGIDRASRLRRLPQLYVRR